MVVPAPATNSVHQQCRRSIYVGDIAIGPFAVLATSESAHCNICCSSQSNHYHFAVLTTVVLAAATQDSNSVAVSCV